MLYRLLTHHQGNFFFSLSLHLAYTIRPSLAHPKKITFTFLQEERTNRKWLFVTCFTRRTPLSVPSIEYNKTDRFSTAPLLKKLIYRKKKKEACVKYTVIIFLFPFRTYAYNSQYGVQKAFVLPRWFERDVESDESLSWKKAMLWLRVVRLKKRPREVPKPLMLKKKGERFVLNRHFRPFLAPNAIGNG